MSERYHPKPNKQQVATSLDECLRESRWALDDEIEAVRSRGGQKTYLSDGHYLGKREQWHIYSFSSDAELRFPDDTPVDLEYRRKKHAGMILSIDGFDIVLALEEHIGDSVGTAILFTSPWFLLVELQARLVELGLRPPSDASVAEKLMQTTLPTGPRNVVQAQALLNGVAKQLGNPLTHNAHQLEAVAAVLCNPVMFIWGPPGTGKTKALGLVASALVQAHESILVVAHSNAAVDVAMESLARNVAKSTEYRDGKVLRYGVSYLPELTNYPYLHTRGVVREKNPRLVNEIERLENEQQALVRQSRHKSAVEQRQELKDQIAAIKELLEPLRDELKQREKELVRQAQVVGCTLSKASIAPEIYERRFDAVLIDEASMAYIPHCAFVAGLARRRTAVFGDFRQLPPISQADTVFTRRWLGKDIFDHAGIIESVDRRQADGRLVLLPIQYRMHPDISAVPNELFYGGRLQDDPGVAKRTQPIVQGQPDPGNSLAVIDLSLLTALCFSEKESHSRFNLVSALVTVELVHFAARSGQQQIGIITPYNAQSRLIHRLLKDLDMPSEQVRVATVHRFQGSERDMIVFDTVEGPYKKPGLPVQGGRGSTAMRLANVAISRARGKFVAVVNCDYLRTHFGRESSLRQLVERVERGSSVRTPTWPQSSGSDLWNGGLPGLSYFADSGAARREIETDLVQAKEEIAVAWPTSLTDYHFSASILKRCDSSRVRFFVTGRGSSNFQVGLKNARIWQAQSETSMGLVSIDRKRMWVYVDPTSPTGQVLRLDMPQTSSLLYAFWRMVPEDDARQETPEERLKKGQSPIGMPCPQCGGPLWPKTGRYGPYLSCTGGCGYTKRITAADATNLARFMGIVCGRCGGQVKGRKGCNGVFLGCANYPDCRWTQALEDII